MSLINALSKLISNLTSSLFSQVRNQIISLSLYYSYNLIFFYICYTHWNMRFIEYKTKEGSIKVKLNLKGKAPQNNFLLKKLLLYANTIQL